MGGAWSGTPSYYESTFGDEVRDVREFKLSGGVARGIYVGGVFQLRGVPFASADRLEPPLPAPPWQGKLDCTSYGPACPQSGLGMRIAFEPMSTVIWEKTFGGAPKGRSYAVGCCDEAACLNLNVYTPGVDGKRRPVLVYLHGGKFVSGSNIDHGIYDGSRFAKLNDLVVVSLNYRFGAFGLQLEDGANNISMRDQIVGLHWVQREISSLGGEPGNVTLVGESAGGISVLNLLASPKTSGLFHRAIISSAGAWALTSEQVEKVNELARQKLGVTELTKDAVKKASMQEMIAITDKADGAISKGMPGWSPVRDGEYVHKDGPLVALAQGLGGHRPLMIGNNSHEMGILAVAMGEFLGGQLAQSANMQQGPLQLLDIAQHATSTRYAQQSVADAAKDLAKAIAEDLERLCGQEPSAAAVAEQLMSLTLSDAHTYCTALAHARGGGAVYTYKFAVPPPVHGHRCVHGMDLFHTWGSLQGPFADYYAEHFLGYKLPLDDELLKFDDEWQAAHAAFARHGVPSALGGTPWQQFPTTMLAAVGGCVCDDMASSTPGLQHLRDVGAVPS